MPKLSLDCRQATLLLRLGRFREKHDYDVELTASGDLLLGDRPCKARLGDLLALSSCGAVRVQQPDGGGRAVLSVMPTAIELRDRLLKQPKPSLVLNVVYTLADGRIGGHASDEALREEIPLDPETIEAAITKLHETGYVNAYFGGCSLTPDGKLACEEEPEEQVASDSNNTFNFHGGTFHNLQAVGHNSGSMIQSADPADLMREIRALATSLADVAREILPSDDAADVEREALAMADAIESRSPELVARRSKSVLRKFEDALQSGANIIENGGKIAQGMVALARMLSGAKDFLS